MFTARPVFATLTQTGIFNIPVGTRCFTVSVVSGSGYLGNAVYPAGQQISMSLPDSKNLLGSPIPVSISGAGVNSLNVFYVQ